MATNSKEEKGSQLEKVGKHFQGQPWCCAKLVAAKHGLPYFVLFIKVFLGGEGGGEGALIFP